MKHHFAKIAAWLKKEWLALLLVLVVCMPGAIEYWAECNPFPAMPEIITEAELREISDYMVHWSNSYEYAMNWVYEYDRDGDGSNDVRIHGFDCSEPERTELYVRTKIKLPTFWQLITGKCGFAPQGEEIAFQDGQACLIITISGETKGDRSELRHAVEAALAAIREEKAEQAAGTYIPPSGPDLQELIEGMLESQQGNEVVE